VRLFDDGAAEIATRTGWPCLGVVPWFDGASALPAEDTLGLPTGAGGGGLVIVMPRLPHIANFDDCDPLRLEPGVSLRLVPLDEPLAADAHVVLLPGSKSTVEDTKALRAAGWDVDLAAHVRRGGRIVGLCGGYQMLGRRIADPQGLEGPAGDTRGLGLLDVETELTAPKVTRRTAGVSLLPGAEGIAVDGYRIHMGRTEGPDTARPLVRLAEGVDGAISAEGRVMGCYLHGMFGADAFRSAFLGALGVASDLAYEARVDATLDALADHLEAAVDTGALIAIAQNRARTA
jgi:adenosylcobyric acid synthase